MLIAQGRRKRCIRNLVLSCFVSIEFWVALGHKVVQSHFCSDQLLKDKAAVRQRLNI